MKYRIFLLSLCFALAAMLPGLQAQNEDFRKTPPKPGPAPVIQMGDYEQFTLPNGLTVIVVENHKIPRVSFQVFVDVPPHLEGDKAGTADLAGQLLKMGTTTRTKAEIDEAVDFIGASLSSSANGLFGSALTKHKDALLDVMADVLLHPSFPEDQFEKLKRQTISGLAQAEQDPNAIADNVGRVLRYGKDHPYGELTTKETVENITVEDCRKFYEQYFKPNISWFIAVGDITADEVRTIAETYFGDWKADRVARPDFVEPPLPDQTRVAFVNKDGAVQSVINITHPVHLQPGHPDAIAARVTNSLLGGFFGSRLMQNLREQHGYTYGARSSLSPDPYVGAFRAWASVRNEVTDSSMTEFLKELRRIREEPVSDEELELVKNVITGQFARSLEQPQTIARFALNTSRYNLPDDYYKNYLKYVESLSATDLQRAARKYIHPDHAWLLVVGNKDEVADKLARFSADGQVHFFDAWGNPVVEGEPLPEDLDAATVLRNYFKAIGVDKPDRIKAVHLVMTAQGGMAFQIDQVFDARGRFANKVLINGSVMQEQVFDGEKGVTRAMGQTIPMKEAEIEQLRESDSAHPLKEWKWLEEGKVKLELDGKETVNGKECYVVKATMPSGQVVKQYYDLATGLKVRETAPVPGQNLTVVTDLDDYREVDGIKFPFKWTISGTTPVPMTMVIDKVEINPELSKDTFRVE